MFLERYYPEFFERVRKKILVFLILVILSFGIISFRIWYLQIMKGGYFKTQSQNNRIRIIALPAYRGDILDRNKEVLVNVRPSFNLYIVPEDTKNIDQVLSLLRTQIDFDIEKVKKSVKSSLPFKHVLIKRNIRRDKVAFIEEYNMDLPGVILNVEPLRSYKNKELASHILGYISEINKEELKKMKSSEYVLGDFIGKYGLEKMYESILQGKKGVKHIEVDSAGRELNVLQKKNPRPGQNLILTIDSTLQKTAERLLNKTRLSGSVVAISPQNGEILAMVSKPSFDPNLFSSGISSKNWVKLINDERHPLQNRSFQGQYPPGSTYKIITAAAGLEEGLVDEETKFYCPGYFQHGKRIYRCWKKRGHGKVNIKEALIHSCDVYFYKLGIKLGIDTISKYANMFGFGKISNINLFGEKPGLTPTKAWKEKNRNEPWVSGETVSASVGQGYTLATPLQLANMIAIIANEGILWRPTLIRRIENMNGETVEEIKPEIVSQFKLKPENFKIIQDALLGVVNSGRGTAWRAKLKKIKIAGKTGTAQVIRMKDDDDDEQVEEKDIPLKFRDHALFVSYAPYENPEIAVAVIVEHGGHGGATAAPIARDIIKAYYRKYLSKKEKS